ncbi:MAG: GTP-binding protein [Candidatus Hermodarchaeota archaeon]
MGDVINLKLIVLGEGEVGKTSIINSFLGEEISENYMPTIGSVTFRKEYVLSEKAITIKLTIWDLGGQKSFNPYNPVHYSNADLAILVFDLTNPEDTIKNLKKEFEERISKSTEECISLLAGNKLDLFDENTQIKKTLQNFFTDKDNFILMSAKNSINVRDCFELLLFSYLKRGEILAPDLFQESMTEDFLKSISKDEQSLKSKLITINSIDTAIELMRSGSNSKTVDSTEEEINELKYNEFINQEIHKVRHQKDDILDQFIINLSELEQALTHIKKTYTKSTEEMIDALRNLLTVSKNDSEKNIELFQKLNREEHELMIISSNLKTENQDTNEDIFHQDKIYNI